MTPCSVVARPFLQGLVQDLTTPSSINGQHPHIHLLALFRNHHALTLKVPGDKIDTGLSNNTLIPMTHMTVHDFLYLVRLHLNNERLSHPSRSSRHRHLISNNDSHSKKIQAPPMDRYNRQLDPTIIDFIQAHLRHQRTGNILFLLILFIMMTLNPRWQTKQMPSCPTNIDATSLTRLFSGSEKKLSPGLLPNSFQLPWIVRQAFKNHHQTVADQRKLPTDIANMSPLIVHKASHFIRSTKKNTPDKAENIPSMKTIYQLIDNNSLFTRNTLYNQFFSINKNYEESFRDTPADVVKNGINNIINALSESSTIIKDRNKHIKTFTELETLAKLLRKNILNNLVDMIKELVDKKNSAHKIKL